MLMKIKIYLDRYIESKYVDEAETTANDAEEVAWWK